MEQVSRHKFHQDGGMLMTVRPGLGKRVIDLRVVGNNKRFRNGPTGMWMR